MKSRKFFRESGNVKITLFAKTKKLIPPHFLNIVLGISNQNEDFIYERLQPFKFDDRLVHCAHYRWEWKCSWLWLSLWKTQYYLYSGIICVFGLVQLIKGALCYSPVIPRLANLIISGINFTEQSCDNKVLRTLVNTQIFPSKVKKRPLVFDFPWRWSGSNENIYLLSTSTKGKIEKKKFSGKIINDIYPCNEFLGHRFNLDCNECTFCEADIESLEHLFNLCKFSEELWDDLYAWLSLKYEIPGFDFKTVKYLFFCLNYDVEFLVNNIVNLANYFIHKCRFFNNPPNVLLFQQDLTIFFKSLKIMRSEKALNLCDLLKVFFIFCMIEPLVLYYAFFCIHLFFLSWFFC